MDESVLLFARFFLRGAVEHRIVRQPVHHVGAALDLILDEKIAFIVSKFSRWIFQHRIHKLELDKIRSRRNFHGLQRINGRDRLDERLVSGGSFGVNLDAGSKSFRRGKFEKRLNGALMKRLNILAEVQICSQFVLLLSDSLKQPRPRRFVIFVVIILFLIVIFFLAVSVQSVVVFSMSECR